MRQHQVVLQQQQVEVVPVHAQPLALLPREVVKLHKDLKGEEECLTLRCIFTASREKKVLLSDKLICRGRYSPNATQTVSCLFSLPIKASAAHFFSVLSLTKSANVEQTLFALRVVG